jgi:hypothetical protein
VSRTPTAWPRSSGTACGACAGSPCSSRNCNRPRRPASGSPRGAKKTPGCPVRDGPGAFRRGKALWKSPHGVRPLITQLFISKTTSLGKQGTPDNNLAPGHPGRDATGGKSR